MTRLLHVESPNVGRQGDHIYRTLQPCRALGQLENLEVISGSLLSPLLHTQLLSADILVLCDVVDMDLVSVVTARRAARKLTVYEINDHFLAPQPWNPIAYLAENFLTRSLSSQLAALSHGVQFTVPELQKVFGHLHSNLRVFPNQLWDLPPQKEKPASKETLRLGFGGSLGHQEDLQWILPALQQLLTRHPRLSLAIMGPKEFRPLFAQIPPSRLDFVPGGSIDDYYRFLDTLDFGLCPNLPTPFNRTRSDVKFLEYAAHGVIALCSDLEPYRQSVTHGQNGFLFSTPQQLLEQLDTLISNASLRSRVQRAAYESVRTSRREPAHAHARWETYQAWAQELGPHTSVHSTPMPLPLPASFSDSRYLRLGEGKLETLLYEGLAALRDGETTYANSLFQEAQKAAPSFYVPYLLEGSLEALKKAQALAPHSAHVALKLGEGFEAQQEFQKAETEYRRVIQLAPALGIGQARLGNLLQKQGLAPQAVELFFQAAHHNPYFVPAVLAVSQFALSQRDFQAVETWTQEAQLKDAWVWQYPYFLGRAQLELGKWNEAQTSLERALALTNEPLPVMSLLAKTYLAQKDTQAAAKMLEAMKKLSGTSL